MEIVSVSEVGGWGFGFSRGSEGLEDGLLGLASGVGAVVSFAVLWVLSVVWGATGALFSLAQSSLTSTVAASALGTGFFFSLLL